MNIHYGVHVIYSYMTSIYVWYLTYMVYVDTMYLYIYKIRLHVNLQNSTLSIAFICHTSDISTNSLQIATNHLTKKRKLSET